MELKDKVIIVTGGNGLIGKSITKYLFKNNAIVINFDIADISNVDCTDYICCDITKPNEVENSINIVINKYNKIDGLVNNAYPRTSDWSNKLEDITLNSWSTNIDLQLNSLFYITKLVTQQMIMQKYGSIVSIASIYGIVGNDFTVYENTNGMTSPAAYSAIKGAVINYTRYLASYLGKYNIRVNTVSPGGVINNQHPNFIKQFENKVPLKRMANPDDISPSVAFLLSNESIYITGHNLVVDGGWTCI